MPLVLAMSSLLAAFGVLALYSQFVTPASPYASQLIVLIGLAVAVDYSLFMITRFRTERRRRPSGDPDRPSTRAIMSGGWSWRWSAVGTIAVAVDRELQCRSRIGAIAVIVALVVWSIARLMRARRRSEKLAAIDVASSTAGRAVFFSGLAVMVSIGGLFLLDDPLFRSMAVGTIAVVLIAVIGSLTFLPATLAILGDGLNGGRLPILGRDAGGGQRHLGPGRPLGDAAPAASSRSRPRSCWCWRHRPCGSGSARATSPRSRTRSTACRP